MAIGLLGQKNEAQIPFCERLDSDSRAMGHKLPGNPFSGMPASPRNWVRSRKNRPSSSSVECEPPVFILPIITTARLGSFARK